MLFIWKPRNCMNSLMYEKTIHINVSSNVTSFPESSIKPFGFSSVLLSLC
eukprot:m.221065 g.221065  ORF g.221065 m.221065 type:complete len:50 (+) comp39954_c1_seq1:63-212(+)